MSVRPAAVAGTWYPGTRGALAREVDGYLAAVPDGPALDVRAIIAPHAGIMFSGPVAAYAYKAAAAASPYDVIALVGPSHFDAFEGVALYPGGAFDSPLGLAQIDGDGVAALAESAIVRTAQTGRTSGSTRSRCSFRSCAGSSRTSQSCQC